MKPLDKVSGRCILLVRCLAMLVIVSPSLSFNPHSSFILGETVTFKRSYLPTPQLKLAPTVAKQPAAVYALEGIIYDGRTLRGIQDVRLEAIHQATNTATLGYTDSTGRYHLQLTTGTYTITPRIYGYSAETLILPITHDTQTNLALSPAPFYRVEGQVFDAHTGYPLHAHVKVMGTPLAPPTPEDKIWSQPITGRYTLNLAQGNTYTLSVTAPGYISRTRTVGSLTDDVSHKDFALVPDLVACTAPGYETGLTWTGVLTESFDPWPPRGTWTIVRSAPDVKGWGPMTQDAFNFTGGFGRCAEADGNDDNVKVSYLQSPVLDLSGFNDAQMTFKFAVEPNDEPVGNRATVGLSPDAGVTWPITLFQRYQTRHREETVTLSLIEAAGKSDARVRFGYQTPDHGWYQVDDVVIRGTPCEPALDTVRLYPSYLEDEVYPCTTHRHPITFVNRSGLTDTVLITYTASPSLIVLNLPDSLGPTPDGAITPFEVTVNVASHALPGSLGYITLTASLAAHPHLSDTVVIAKRTSSIGGWDSRTDSPVVVSDHALIATDDYVYQIGGTVDGTTGISDVLRYDPLEDTWTSAGLRPMDTGLTMIDGDTVGGDLYILGGAVDAETADGHVRIYDVSADHWYTGAIATHAPTRVGYAAVAMNGLLYRIGGGDPTTGLFATHTMIAYDPSTDEWDEGVNNYLWHVRWPCAGVIDDKLYVAGGLNGDGQGVGSAAVYDALHWSSEQMADLPLGVTLWGAADFVQDGKLFCVGGVQGDLTDPVTNTVWLYDPITDHWSREAPIATPKARFEGVAWAGADTGHPMGYILGGRDANGNAQATLARSTPCPACQSLLTIEKTGPDHAYTDPAHPRAISYTIVIHNAGEVTATARLTDVLPVGMTYASGPLCQGGTGLCQYTQDTRTIGWQGALVPRETLTVTFDVSVTIPISPQAEVTVVNTATVGYRPDNGGEQSVTQITDTHALQISEPPVLTWIRDVYINDRWMGTATHSPFTVIRDDAITVMDTLSYTGAFSRFATLVEHWPHNLLSHQGTVHTAGVSGSLPSGAHGWGITLIPNSRAILSKTFYVSQTGTITFTGWLTPDHVSAEGIEGIAPQSQVVRLTPLLLQKQGPAMPEFDSMIAYTITLRGAEGLNGPVWVTDTLPSGVTFSHILSPTYGNAWYSPTTHALYWEIAEALNPPEFLTVTVNVTVTAAPRSRVTNTVRATYHNQTLITSTAFNIPYANLVIIPRSRQAVLNPGATATRTLIISNTGTGNLAWTFDEIAAPWLRIGPSMTGTVAPASSAGLNLLFSAYTADTALPLDDGLYTTTLTVVSNDPDAPIILIPITLTVQSGCLPVSELALTVTPAPPQAGEVLSFTGYVAQGTDPITYTWAFGDAPGTSDGMVVSHTYSISDTYPIFMTATNACGVDAITQSMHVLGAPKLALTPSSLTVFLKPESTTTRTLSLSNLGTANLRWHISDVPTASWLTLSPSYGTVSPDDTTLVSLLITSDVMTHGTYSTTLALHSDDPTGSPISLPVTLIVTTTCQPIAGTVFNFDPAMPTAGTPITFTADVIGGSDPITYKWDFGDGTIGQGQGMPHTYAVSATYTMVMTATNACSADTTDALIQVSGEPQVKVTPSALWITLNPDDTASRFLSIYNTGTAGLHWQMTTTPAVGWLTSMPTTGVTSPDSLSQITLILDAYALTEGAYTATLTLSHNDSTTSTIDIPVTLFVTRTCQPVAGAAFIVDPVSLTAGDPLTFTGGAMRGSAPITYTWDFGDDTLGQGQRVSHTYAVSATYPVVMTATNACGADTTDELIQINGEPQIAITPLALQATLDIGDTAERILTIHNRGSANLHWRIKGISLVNWLTATSTGGVILPDNLRHVEVIFDAHSLAKGTYTTTLVLESNAPTASSMSLPITLVISPTCQPVAGAAFIFNPAAPSAGDPITFTAGALWGSAPITYAWHLGDGTLKHGQSVTHAYRVSNTFTILMTATNPCGTDTSVESIQIDGVPRMHVTSLSLAMTRLNYVHTQPNSIIKRTLSIHNNGTADLHWQMIETPAATWLTPSPSEGTLAPKSATDVDVILDTHHQDLGTYTTILNLHSDDPDAPSLEIPIILVVTSTCRSPSGTTFIVEPLTPTAGAPITFTASVIEGSEPITYIWHFDRDVSVGQETTRTYPISGTYPVVLTATNLCGHTVTTREVSVIGQPNLHLAPDTLNVTLRAGTVTSRLLSLHNRGTAPLRWHFHEAPPRIWVTETPTRGILAPFAKRWLTLTFNARALAATPTPYTTTLRLQSNAPNAPLTALHVAFTVTVPASTCIPIAGAHFTHSLDEPYETLTLTGTTSQGTPPITYTWDFHDDRPPLIGNPITYALFPIASSTKYTITMQARNPCPSEAIVTRTFSLRHPSHIYLPLVLRN